MAVIKGYQLYFKTDDDDVVYDVFMDSPVYSGKDVDAYKSVLLDLIKEGGHPIVVVFIPGKGTRIANNKWLN